MSAFGELIIDIEEEIERGDLSFRDIAMKYEVPLTFVDAVAKLIEKDYDDSVY